MMKSTKTQQKNTTKADLYVLLPVLFALCIIPLVILTHDYETAFSSFEWFNNEELSQIDSFEYAKGILVTITGAAAAMILFVHEYHAIQKKKRLFANADLKICILWAIYPIMALISGIFSKYTDLAFTGGGYGQWQTVWVLCSYSILFMYAYTFIDTENRAILTIKCMMVTTGLLALLGFLQSIDHNPLKWEWVQKIMTSQSATESVTFKDGVSSVILAFNNPNYVGPYVAMVLPIVIAFIFIRSSKNKITSILCRVAGVLISISFVIILKGADSSAGLIATTVGIVFAGLLLLTGLFPKKNMPPAENDEQDESSKKKNKTGLIIGLCAVAVLCVGIVVMVQNGTVKNLANRVLEGSEDTRNVASIVNTKKDELRVTMRDDSEFTLTPTVDETGKITFSAKDADGVEIAVQQAAEQNVYQLADKRFEMLSLAVNNFNLENSIYSGFKFNDNPNSISWTFMYVDGKWKYYTPFGKLIRLREVESIGFKDTQNIANRRGFIWSRTIPLMKDYWFKGVGPNAFILAFPNHDFVGSKRVGDNTTLVDKPHNAFLQTYIQTGGLSAVAYIGLWLLYICSGIALFWRKRHYTDLDKVSLGMLAGIFAFFVAEITNDTVIGSQNIYWILLGTGYAINRTIRTRN